MIKKLVRRVAVVLCVLSCFSSGVLAEEYNHDAAMTNARLGMAFLDKGLYTASKEHLLTAIKEDPKLAVGWYSMAYYLEKTGNINAADQYYQKAVSVEPHSGSAINNYGTFLCRTGKYQAAIDTFLRAANEPNYLQSASAYENAGICALKIPNNTLALKYFHEALDNNPSMPFSLLSLARLYHQTGNEASAEKYFTLFQNLALYQKPASVVEQYRQYAFSGSVVTHQELPMPKTQLH